MDQFFLALMGVVPKIIQRFEWSKVDVSLPAVVNKKR
jgi:hypothetical protein